MKKITKKQQEIIDNLNPPCEDCLYYRRWRGEMMCYRLSPFLASKETQRIRQAGSTMNCGTEGRHFTPNPGADRMANEKGERE